MVNGWRGGSFLKTKLKVKETQLKKRVRALKFGMAVALERYNVEL